MLNIILQLRYEGFGGGSARTTDPRVTYIIMGAIVVVIAVIVLISRLSKGKDSNGTGKKFRKGAFKKDAKKIGLPDPFIKVLINLIQINEITNPHRLLQNSSQLDLLLNDTMQKIEESDKSEDEKDAQKSALYRIKQIIELNAKGKKSVTSTRSIRHGQDLVLIVEGSKYRSKLSKNLKESLHIHAPVTKSGKTIVLKRWTKVTVQFWKNEGEMYSFTTKVISEKTMGGVPIIMLQHAKDITVSQQRRFRRKSLTRSVYFGLVTIVATGRGRNQKKQAVVAGKKNILGSLVDISTGGCSLKTNFPLKRGELIRLQLEIEKGKPFVAFGKVVSSHKERYSGTVMHIQFTKVTRKNINEINAVIYNTVSGREMD